MGSSSGGGGGVKTTRYAPYIEAKHDAMLNVTASYSTTALLASPYSNYTDVEVDDALFGLGYLITSYPSLYDMFGKFMAGFDVETLWSSLFPTQMNKTELQDTIDAQMQLFDDALKVNEVPNLSTIARDTNSVQSSTFIIGKANIESYRTKTFCEVSADIKFAILTLINQKWTEYLNWSKEVIAYYAFNLKFYFLAQSGIDNTNTTFDVRNKLWPFTVLDFERAALGALQGATYQKTMTPRKRSLISKALLVMSYTVNGVYIGASIGGPPGAIIGGVIGFIVGIAMVLFE